MIIRQKIYSTLKIIGLTGLWYISVFALTTGADYFLPKNILKTAYESDQTAFLLNTVIMFIATMLVLLIIGKFLCKAPLNRFGFTFIMNWFKHWGIGLAMGTFSVFFVWLSIVLFNGYYVQINEINKDVLSSLAYLLVGMMFVGYYEEALTRGAMAYVGRNGGRVFCSVVIGLIFSFMHIFNVGFNLLSALNILLIAILSSQLTWLFGNLWVAIGFHTAWNFTMGTLGMPISGLQFLSIFSSDYTATNSLIHGGVFGMESSLITFVFLIFLIVCIGFMLKRQRHNNDIQSASYITKNNRICISASLLFILLAGASTFKIVKQEAPANNFVKTYYQVVDTYGQKDNISAKDFFTQKSSLERLQQMNNSLNSSLDITFIEFNNNPIEVIGYYDNPLCFVDGYGNSDLSNQKIKINGKQEYITPINSIQINKTMLNIQNLQVCKGRNLEANDFEYEDNRISLLMGYDYMDYYEIGDSLELFFLGKKFNGVVVGFFEKGSSINMDLSSFLLDKYVLIPYFTEISINDLKDKDIYANIDSDYFIKMYYIFKNNGYLIFENKNDFEKYKAKIDKMADKYDLHFTLLKGY